MRQLVCLVLHASTSYARHLHASGDIICRTALSFSFVFVLVPSARPPRFTTGENRTSGVAKVALVGALMAAVGVASYGMGHAHGSSAATQQLYTAVRPAVSGMTATQMGAPVFRQSAMTMGASGMCCVDGLHGHNWIVGSYPSSHVFFVPMVSYQKSGVVHRVRLGPAVDYPSAVRFRLESIIS